VSVSDVLNQVTCQ